MCIFGESSFQTKNENLNYQNQIYHHTATKRCPMLLIIGLLLLLSCSDNQQSKKYQIGFAQCCGDQWRTIMENEMYRQLSFHPNVELEIKVADGNSEKQITQIREFIKQGIDLLIVAPNESDPLTDVVEMVYNQGIPVILIDRKTRSEAYTAYIGGDNYEIGKTAGHYIASKFNGKGKVLELQIPMTISPAIERSRGFRDALKTYPNLNIVAVIETEWNLTQVESLLPPVLKKHPDGNIIFGHTDLVAEQAYRAAQKMGKAENIFFVGIDGIPGVGRGVEAVEDGILNASLLYPTGGEKAIEVAVAILEDKPFDKKNILHTAVIDSSNATILNQQFAQINNLQQRIDEQKALFSNLENNYLNLQQLLFFLVVTLLVAVGLGIGLWRSLQTKQRINKSLAAKNMEVIEKQEQLLKVSQQLREVSKAKVNFFTNISHEFRTPLTLILAFIEDILSKRRLNPTIRKNVEVINRNAYRLLRLVNQVMDFRKIESDKMTVKASQQDLIDFTQNVMKSFEPLAAKRKIDFRLVTRKRQLMAWFDLNMLDKVLFNLLSNAFKYTNDGGKIQIIITTNETKDSTTIIVEDNGKGMTEKAAQHIFEPFYQADTEVNRQYVGTGLGLSLSKSLMNLHSGNIRCNTTLGKGSQFIITMPLGNAHFDPNQLVAENRQFVHQSFLFQQEIPTTSVVKKINNPKTSEQKLLIIEDNEDLQLFLGQKLSDQFEVSQATDGQDGLQQAQAIIPDMIICDVNLPTKNGLAITQILKEDIRTSHIPIILLTAKTDMKAQLQGTKAGADAYIAKPFNVQLLLEKINNLLHNRKILKETYSLGLKKIQPSKSTLNKLDQQFIQDLTRYINENYTRQDFQVKDLCRELNLSRSQFYRKVKALLGISITDHIQNIRLQKAQELLNDQANTISDVAYAVGYTSPHYFATVFKSKFNITPSQFRSGDKVK